MLIDGDPGVGTGDGLGADVEGMSAGTGDEDNLLLICCHVAKTSELLLPVCSSYCSFWEFKTKCSSRALYLFIYLHKQEQKQALNLYDV